MYIKNSQNNIFKKEKIKITKKGFTLLFAVLVSTLVLAIGASIISIALKQVILSGSARDSQFAFYAANTGVECALYWYYNGRNSADDGGPIFKINDFQSGPNSSEDIKCANHNIIIDSEGGGVFDNACDPSGGIDKDTGFCFKKEKISNLYHFKTKFRIEFADVEYCADVIVDRYVSDGNDRKTLGQDVTKIESRGYNTCDETNPRRIERTLNIES